MLLLSLRRASLVRLAVSIAVLTSLAARPTPASAHWTILPGSVPLAVIKAVLSTGDDPLKLDPLAVTPAVSGSLIGASAPPVSPVNLTTLGTSDWAHWGLGGAAGFDHKATGSSQISNYTLVGSGVVGAFTTGDVAYTWTDGTPTVSATGSTTSLNLPGANNGFSFTAPADTVSRVLKVFVGGGNCAASFTAHLSDGSAPDYTATVTSFQGVFNTVYTLTYNAASAGKTLLVTWKLTSGPGAVTLQSAALSGGAPPSPDFSLSATPASVPQGSTGTSTVTINPVGGFNGPVSLSASGLPTGVTAAFGTNPATGSSVLTFTAAANAVAAPSTITITGTSGSLTHTTTLTLTVTGPPTIPLAPTGLVAAPGNGFVTLTWTASVGATSYSVKSSTTSGGPYTTIASPAATSYTNSGLVNGTTYYYVVSATNSAGTSANSAQASATPTATVSGALTGVSSVPESPVNLTATGLADWAHWGLNGATSFDHKATGNSRISNFTLVGTGTAAAVANTGVGYTWTDGSPTASASATTTGISMAGSGNGFSITAPADTVSRTLKIFVGGATGSGALTVHLSDSSAADYTALPSNFQGGYNQLYTLTYNAASAGKSLIVTWKMASGPGSISLQAATLTGGVAPIPDFSLSAAPTSVTAPQGGSGTSTIAINPVNGFNAAVNLSASGLPTGVTGSFGTNPATGSTVLTLSASGSATPGPATVTITGTSGSLTHTTTVALTVTANPDFSISASPDTMRVVQGTSGASTITVNLTGGLAGPVTLSASGLPSGVTASFGTNPASADSILTLTASNSAATGLATVTISGVAGAVNHSATIALTVVSNQDFSLSASPSNLTVVQGASRTSTVSINAINGFNALVALSVDGLPAGVTASFGTNPATSSSILTLSANDTAVTGPVTVTITGISGSLTHIAAVSLNVVPAPDFSLSAAPSSVSIQQGAVGTSTVTVNGINGFNGAVNLSASGVPIGVSAVFGTNPATGTSNLTLTAIHSAAIGSATVTITGISGSLTRTATVNLTVTPGPDFSLSVAPSTVTVTQGANTQVTVTIIPVYAFTAPVTLTAAGLVPGVTASFAPNPATGTSILTLSANNSAALISSSVTISGQSGSLTRQTNLTVGVLAQPVLTSIAINPPSVLINGGFTQQFTGIALDQYHVPMSPQPAITWTVSGGGSIVSSTGLFTAGNVGGGPFIVTAKSGSVTGNASVMVNVSSPNDFNGDGKTDLVLQNSNTNQGALWYLNNSTLLTGAYTSSAPPAGWAIVGEGNFNNDGKPDLVLQNTSNKQIALWYMNGPTVLSSHNVTANPASDMSVAAVGDFNGDGNSDLVLQSAATHQITIWYMNGPSQLSGQAVSTIPPAGWAVAGAADFNGDGKTDLVLQNTVTNAVAIWYLNGTALVSGAYVTATPGAGWSVAGIGDFNSDGKPDLVLQNKTTNKVALWYLSSAVLITGAYVSVTPAAGWKVAGPR